MGEFYINIELSGGGFQLAAEDKMTGEKIPIVVAGEGYVDVDPTNHSAARPIIEALAVAMPVIREAGKNSLQR